MISLPEGNVKQFEVMVWAQEQARFLSPAQTMVLWCLCLNAFYADENPEQERTGTVLRMRSTLQSIRERTGLSLRTIQRSLDGLQKSGYIYVVERQNQSRRGREPQRISIYWDEAFDELRDLSRTGIRTLHEDFSSNQKRYRTALPDNVIRIKQGRIPPIDGVEN